MTIHEFGDKNNPVIMLFPGTMCYWRGNFGGVIDMLAEAFCGGNNEGQGGSGMILFFSATGNCKYVAARLAQATGQEILSIVDCIRAERHTFQDETIGIISPCYFWGLPSIVREFLEGAHFQADYLYFVATYGTTPGAAGYMADRSMRGHVINAHYCVRMADTWTPVFDLSTPKKVAAFTATTEADIDKVICGVQKRHANRRMSPRIPVFLADLIAQPIYNGRMRRTAHFHVEDGCIGCGLCAKQCPVQAIEMRHGRPVWVKAKCATCLGCLHRCPKFAIQYGKNTRKHGQYTNPNVRL